MNAGVRTVGAGLVAPLTALVSALVLLCGTNASAAADAFSGKIIRIIVGSEPGGGFDLYARALSRHMGRLIPGAPTIIVQNMPGAGSGKAAAYVYHQAPKDGTVIAAIQPGALFNPLFHDPAQTPYTPAKFIFLGTADSGTRVCVTSRSGKVKTFEDTFQHETVIGGAQPGAATYDYPTLFKNVTPARFKVVPGYKNNAESTLAMERGETEGICGWDWSSLRAQHPDAATKFNIIVQAELRPNQELMGLSVPSIRKFVKDEKSLKMLELVIAQQVFGRPYMVAPGTDPKVVEILRKAFDATVHDPEFLADAERSKLQVLAEDGATVQGVIDKLYAAPKEIVDLAAASMKQ